MTDSETIFALSSGPPPSAIAVIRVSGQRARVALEAMIGRVPQPRHATFAKVCDPATGEMIDEGLALWFPGPKSETSSEAGDCTPSRKFYTTKIIDGPWSTYEADPGPGWSQSRGKRCGVHDLCMSTIYFYTTYIIYVVVFKFRGQFVLYKSSKISARSGRHILCPEHMCTW